MKTINSKYEQRGVSADKKDVHAAIKNIDKGLFPNAFCKVLPDAIGGQSSYCNILHADTAGTKTALAYLYWKETGDISVWEGIVQDALVMNLDDMACAGATGPFLVSSTIGRNKNLVPGEVVSTIINAAEKFKTKMHEFGVDLQMAGGETADVGDIVRTADVGFTVFTRLPKKDIIDINIQPGNVIVGLASFSRAIYETEYNSGIGSNGLTAARHELLHSIYKNKYSETVDPAMPNHLQYSGQYKVTDIEPETGIPVGKLLLSPTRAFVPLINKIKAANKKNINGIIHCTGGGQTKVLKFCKNVHIIKNNLFEPPPVFKLLQKSSMLEKELFQVFNMGHRLEMYTDNDTAQQIISIAKALQIDAKIIGKVEAHSPKPKLSLSYGGNTYSYQ